MLNAYIRRFDVISTVGKNLRTKQDLSISRFGQNQICSTLTINILMNEHIMIVDFITNLIILYLFYKYL